MAGWAVVLGTGIIADEWVDEDGEIGSLYADRVRIDGTESVWVGTVARDLLDLRRWDLGLFGGANTLDDIRRIRDEIATEQSTPA